MSDLKDIVNYLYSLKNIYPVSAIGLNELHKEISETIDSIEICTSETLYEKEKSYIWHNYKNYSETIDSIEILESFCTSETLYEKEKSYIWHNYKNYISKNIIKSCGLNYSDPHSYIYVCNKVHRTSVLGSNFTNEMGADDWNDPERNIRYYKDDYNEPEEDDFDFVGILFLYLKCIRMESIGVLKIDSIEKLLECCENPSNIDVCKEYAHFIGFMIDEGRGNEDSFINLG
jgi:hypothetical protein